MSDVVDLNRRKDRGRAELHKHWGLYLVEGAILVVLGSAAIFVPPIASFAVAIFLGWLFVVGGIVGLIATIAGRHAPGFGWAIVSSIVGLVAGILLVGWPVAGAISLTFVLTAFLIIDGIVTIFFALDHRRQLSQRWGWLVANGVLDLLLAAFIIVALPQSALWALGLIVGIDLVFAGWSLIAMAIAARRPLSDQHI